MHFLRLFSWEKNQKISDYSPLCRRKQLSRFCSSGGGRIGGKGDGNGDRGLDQQINRDYCGFNGKGFDRARRSLAHMSSGYLLHARGSDRAVRRSEPVCAYYPRVRTHGTYVLGTYYGTHQLLPPPQDTYKLASIYAHDITECISHMSAYICLHLYFIAPVSCAYVPVCVPKLKYMQIYGQIHSWKDCISIWIYSWIHAFKHSWKQCLSVCIWLYSVPEYMDICILILNAVRIHRHMHSWKECISVCVWLYYVPEYRRRCIFFSRPQAQANNWVGTSGSTAEATGAADAADPARGSSSDPSRIAIMRSVSEQTPSLASSAATTGLPKR